MAQKSSHAARKKGGVWKILLVLVVLLALAVGGALLFARNEISGNCRPGAIEKVGGAKKGKAIIIINPAEPPLIMRDTVHCLTEAEPDQPKITASIHAMIKEVQKYVPGYKLVNGPVFDGKRVSIFLEVEGLGDYLPKYAGNLDIMTAAAARTAEMFAEAMLAGKLTLEAVPA